MAKDLHIGVKDEIDIEEDMEEFYANDKEEKKFGEEKPGKIDKRIKTKVKNEREKQVNTKSTGDEDFM